MRKGIYYLLRSFKKTIMGKLVFWPVLLAFAVLATPAFIPTGSSAQTSPVCVPPPSGLVSWWPGDGNANDIINSNGSSANRVGRN